MSALPAAARCRLLGVLAAIALAAGLAAASAQAAIYKYVDRHGVTHYSDSLSSVPDEYRDQVHDVSGAVSDMPGVQVVLPGQPGKAQEPGPGTAIPGVDVHASDLDPSGAIGGLLAQVGFGVVLLLLLAIPVLFVISALIFRLACRLAGEEPPGLGRACLVVFVQGLAGSAVGAAVSGLGMLLGLEAAGGAAASIALGVGSSLLSWLASAGVLMAMMGYGFLRCLWIGILNTLLVIVLIAVPLVGVAFVVGLAS